MHKLRSACADAEGLILSTHNMRRARIMSIIYARRRPPMLT
jgi:hypothetical protein